MENETDDRLNIIPVLTIWAWTTKTHVTNVATYKTLDFANLLK